MNELSVMAQKYGTDKKMGRRNHGYTDHYEQYFKPLRYEPIVVLEIGVKHGESLKLWEEYFPNAMIYGIDVRKIAKACETDRIKVFLGDQSNAEFLDKAVEEMVGPPAIVIDDGSHYPPHQTFSLTHLFPHVAPGGMYIVEDLESSYGSGRFRRFSFDHELAATRYLKTIVDDINYPFHRQMFNNFTHYVKSIHFYMNLAVVLKNSEAETIIRVPDVVLRLIVENEIKTIAHLGVSKNRLCRAILAPYGVRKHIDEYWAIDEWKDDSTGYKNVVDMKKWAFNLNILKTPLLEAKALFWAKRRFDMVFFDLGIDYAFNKQLLEEWKLLVGPGGFLVGHSFGKKKWEEATRAVTDVLGEVEVRSAHTWVYRC